MTVCQVIRQANTAYATLADRVGARTGVGVPVFVGGALWGSLGAMLPETAVPADATELLERFAQLTSAALANSEAQHRLRDEARLERTLQEVSTVVASGGIDATGLFALIAARVGGLLDAPAAMVVRVDGTAGTPVGTFGLDALPDRLPLTDANASSAAWRTGRPARVGDLGPAGADPDASQWAAGYRTAVAVPVRLRGRP